jgi:hypothetical protein
MNGLAQAPPSWAVGVLTWNRTDRCRQTVESLRELILGSYSLTVLDNGSDPPFEMDGVDVVREEENLGAGAGVTALARHLLGTGAPYILFTEDDWGLERVLPLPELEKILADDRVGQIRLAARPERPSERYWTYALEGEAAIQSLVQADAPLHGYAAGCYQLVRLLWSHNPFACRREVAERFLLTGLDEIRMARPYLASGLLTASTTPGHFCHAGTIRERRGEPGWKR